MKEKKTRRMMLYQLNDGEAIAAYLEKMARKGWLLEKFNNILTFRQIEPGEYKFAVTYFPEGSVFDPAPTEGQETYIDYCRAAGWELAAVRGPIQIFYSEGSDPIPIETDEAQKLAAARAVMNKTMVLAYVLLLISFLLNGHNWLDDLLTNPLYTLSSPLSLTMLVCCWALVVILGFFLIDHWVWCARSKRSVENGGACLPVSTKSRLAATYCIFALTALMLVGILAQTADKSESPGIIWILVGTLAMYALAFYALSLLRKHGRSRGAVKWGFVAVMIALVAALGYGSVRLVESGALQRKSGETYTDSRGHTTRIFRDELPVTLEDLGYTVTPDDHCSYRERIQSTPLAAIRSYEQSPHAVGSRLPLLSYSVTVIKWDALREFCWDKASKPEVVRLGGYYATLGEYVDTDPAPWGAEEAKFKDFGSTYLLLYPDRIVTVRLESNRDELTAEGIATFTQFLMNIE